MNMNILIGLGGVIFGGIITWAVAHWYYKKQSREFADFVKWMRSFNEREIKPFEDKANFYKNLFPENTDKEFIRRYFEDIQSMAHNSYERNRDYLKNITPKNIIGITESFDIDNIIKNDMYNSVIDVISNETSKTKECIKKALLQQRKALKNIAAARIKGKINDDEMDDLLDSERDVLTVALLLCQVKENIAKRVVNASIDAYINAVIEIERRKRR